MTLKRKLTLAALVTSAATLSALLLIQAANVQAQGKVGGGLNASGAVYGNLTPEGWLNNVNFTLGNKMFTAVFLANGADGKHWHDHSPASGGWSGNELWHWKVYAGDTGAFVGTFATYGHYQASASSAPGLFTIHETAALIEGTGIFAHASGQMSFQGPFTIPMGTVPVPDERQLFVICEMHGTLSGVEF